MRTETEDSMIFFIITKKPTNNLPTILFIKKTVISEIKSKTLTQKTHQMRANILHTRSTGKSFRAACRLTLLKLSDAL